MLNTKRASSSVSVVYFGPHIYLKNNKNKKKSFSFSRHLLMEHSDAEPFSFSFAILTQFRLVEIL